VLAVHVAPHGHAQSGAGAPARLLAQLQGDVIEDHDIVPSDGALLEVTDDRVELDPVQGHEGRRGIRRRVRELRVVLGDEAAR
jgi:hypothetical protein